MTNKNKVATALIFGVIGIVSLVISHAATPTFQAESENGSISGCANVVSDVTASAGSAVQLGGCTQLGSAPTGLDASGQTIPDTNYQAGTCTVQTTAVCPNTIFMSPSGSDSNVGTKALPVLTINKAATLVAAGGYIVMRGGTYRDWYNDGSGNYAVVQKAFTLQAYPHEQPWFDGSDVEAAGNWTSDGAGHWYMGWNTPSFCMGNYNDYAYNNQAADNSGPCTHEDMYLDPSYGAAGDGQMVFVDGTNEREVTSLNSASNGAFYYDWASKRIYISSDPSSHKVELTARPYALVIGPSGGGYALKGVGFRRYASDEVDNNEKGAVFMGGGGNDLVENVVFTQQAANGLAIAATANTVVRNSVFAYNGLNGLTAYGHASKGTTDGLDIENNVFNYTNTEHYGTNCNKSCDMSSIKLAYLNGYTIKHNIIENGQGIANGAWCDTNCSGGKFLNNYVANNTNGYGYLYEVGDSGIVASNLFLNNQYGIAMLATNSDIYNNTLVSNSGYGIKLYDDSRSQITDNLRLGNNIYYGTSTDDNYFGNIGGTAGPDDFIAALDYDSYYRTSSGNNLLRWQQSSSSNNTYATLQTFAAAHAPFEAHGQDTIGGGDPFFMDATTGNYAIRTNSGAYHSGGPIPADIATALGISGAAGQNRGAFTWPGSK